MIIELRRNNIPTKVGYYFMLREKDNKPECVLVKRDCYQKLKIDNLTWNEKLTESWVQKSQFSDEITFRAELDT